MGRTLIGAGLCALLATLLWLRQDSTDEPIRREIFALGTLVQITIAAEDNLDHRQAQVAINATGLALQAFHERWAADGEGALAQLNDDLADDGSARLNEELAGDISGSIRLCQSSGARFDPAIGHLVRLWGFHDESAFRESPPADEDIRSLLSSMPSLCDATIVEGVIKLPSPGVMLDFGAAAKGRAVAEAIAVLRSHGIHAAIVNAGGDLQVLGAPRSRNWRIGIRHPRPADGKDILAALDVQAGESVFTSGDYERFFEHGGKRYHHILDPKSGYPAGGLISATVVHLDPWLGDAASTALFVAGPDAAESVMDAMGIGLYLWVSTDGRRHVSPGLAPRIEWLDDAR